MFDIGVNVSVGGLVLTASQYSGTGVGIGQVGENGASAIGTERKSKGGTIQTTYVIPAGTKLGVSYTESKLYLAADENSYDAKNVVAENNRWTVGAYHPLTKHLNLVAEYNNTESTDHQGYSVESSAVSLGAILFF